MFIGNIVNIVQHSHLYNSFLLIIVACIVIHVLLVAILYRITTKSHLSEITSFWSNLPKKIRSFYKNLHDFNTDMGHRSTVKNEQPSHFNETDETGEIEFICEPIWVCSFC
jgi:hypothetical protein